MIYTHPPSEGGFFYALKYPSSYEGGLFYVKRIPTFMMSVGILFEVE